MCYSVTALYRRYRAVTDLKTRVTISIKSVCCTGQSAGGRIAQLKFTCGSGHLARAMDATEYSDDRAEPATTTGMMTLLRFPSGSQQQTQHRVEWIPSSDSEQQTQHRVEWIPSADRALAAKGPLATAKLGTRHDARGSRDAHRR